MRLPIILKTDDIDVPALTMDKRDVIRRRLINDIRQLVTEFRDVKVESVVWLNALGDNRHAEQEPFAPHIYNVRVMLDGEEAICKYIEYLVNKLKDKYVYLERCINEGKVAPNRTFRVTGDFFDEEKIVKEDFFNEDNGFYQEDLEKIFELDVQCSVTIDQEPLIIVERIE